MSYFIACGTPRSPPQTATMRYGSSNALQQVLGVLHDRRGGARSTAPCRRRRRSPARPSGTGARGRARACPCRRCRPRGGSTSTAPRTSSAARSSASISPLCSEVTGTSAVPIRFSRPSRSGRSAPRRPGRSRCRTSPHRARAAADRPAREAAPDQQVDGVAQHRVVQQREVAEQEVVARAGHLRGALDVEPAPAASASSSCDFGGSRTRARCPSASPRRSRCRPCPRARRRRARSAPAPAAARAGAQLLLALLEPADLGLALLLLLQERLALGRRQLAELLAPFFCSLRMPSSFGSSARSSASIARARSTAAARSGRRFLIAPARAASGFSRNTLMSNMRRGV
jgi:hypothetical protein